MSRIGIVVSAGSKMIRRIVVPDVSDAELGFHPISHGEQMLVINKPSNFDIAAVPAMVEQLTGVTPPSSRCAVVVKANAVSGSVVNIIHADPAVDSVQGCTLMLDPTAEVGWTWSASSGLQPRASAV